MCHRSKIRRERGWADHLKKSPYIIGRKVGKEMKFEDLLAFAKAGYKPADVKELLAIEPTTETITEPDVIEEPVVEVVEEDVQPEEKIDYKALYEAEQKKLKGLQAVNRNQNIKGTDNSKSDQETFSDLVRSFM